MCTLARLPQPIQQPFYPAEDEMYVMYILQMVRSGRFTLIKTSDHQVLYSLNFETSKSNLLIY